MTRDHKYEDQCYRRRNAVVALVQRLVLAALAPANLQAETDGGFAARKERSEECVQTTSWMNGFFINVGDAGFTKAQERTLLGDLAALLKARVEIRRAGRIHKRFIQVTL